MYNCTMFTCLLLLSILLDPKPTNSIPVNTYIAIGGYWTNTIGRVYRHVIRS